MNKLVKVSDIKTLIFELRGQKVMLDKDLAAVYGVRPIRLREQVKRNQERFPEDFMFQLNEYEVKMLVSQNAIPSRGSLGGYRPYAFTRNGANMLSTVLRTKKAVKRSIHIMRAFSALEEAVSKGRRKLVQSPEILKELSVHSKAIMHLFIKDRSKTKDIGRIKDIVNKIITLLQQMVIESID